MKIKLLIIIFTLLSTTKLSLAKTKSICGLIDNRAPSNDLKIGRGASNSINHGCTVTMIGRSCALTAGHCDEFSKKVEFNVPDSQNNRTISPPPEDIYSKNDMYFARKFKGIGSDWAVVTYGRNSVTGKYPGDVQGYYEVEMKKNTVIGEEVYITGFGRDFKTKKSNYTQQSTYGEITGIARYFWEADTIEYLVDTMNGNSGSTIISAKTNKIIGIHTYGSCNTDETIGNQGTYIPTAIQLKSAIKKCLALDRKLD